jgi:hypothetical protein
VPSAQNMEVKMLPVIYFCIMAFMVVLWSYYWINKNTKESVEKIFPIGIGIAFINGIILYNISPPTSKYAFAKPATVIFFTFINHFAPFLIGFLNFKIKSVFQKK